MSELLPEEFNFGKFGLIDMKPCKARTKMLKRIEKGCKKKVKLTIEAEIDDVWNGFDGIGQEFTLNILKVKVKI